MGCTRQDTSDQLQKSFIKALGRMIEYSSGQDCGGRACTRQGAAWGKAGWERRVARCCEGINKLNELGPTMTRAEVPPSNGTKQSACTTLKLNYASASIYAFC